MDDKPTFRFDEKRTRIMIKKDGLYRFLIPNGQSAHYSKVN